MIALQKQPRFLLSGDKPVTPLYLKSLLSLFPFQERDIVFEKWKRENFEKTDKLGLERNI